MPPEKTSPCFLKLGGPGNYPGNLPHPSANSPTTTPPSPSNNYRKPFCAQSVRSILTTPQNVKGKTHLTMLPD